MEKREPSYSAGGNVPWWSSNPNPGHIPGKDKNFNSKRYMHPNVHAAAAAKALQLCPTLCDPIDGSSPGSPIPGTLEAGLKDFARADILRQIVLDNQPTCCHGYCTEGPWSRLWTQDLFLLNPRSTTLHLHVCSPKSWLQVMIQKLARRPFNITQILLL